MKYDSDTPNILKQEARLARLEQAFEDLQYRLDDMLNRLAELELSSMGEGFSFDRIEDQYNP